MLSHTVLRASGHRLYYGWVIVGVVFVANFAGAGLGGYVLMVLIKPMQAELGWSRAAILGAATTANLIGALVAPLVGRLVDRHGARAIMAFGALMQGLLLLVLANVNAIWQLYLLYGLGGALANAELHGVAPLTAIANWFVRRRGRAVAFAMMGVSLSGAVFVSLTQYIVDLSSWRTAWVVMGVINLVLVVLPVWLFMRRRPEDMGLRPDGVAEPVAAIVTGVVTPLQNEAPSWTAHQAVRSRAFWLLSASVFVYSIPMMGVFMHIPAYYSDIGFSAVMAASAMSLYALGTMLARLFWGFLVERFHVRYCMSAACIAASVGLVVIMSFASGPLPPAWMLFAVSFYQGFIVGGFVILNGVVWPDYFGRLHAGAVRGMATPIQAFAGAGGPLFAAFLFDEFGSYRAAFAIFLACYFFAAAFVLLAKPPARRGEERLPVAAPRLDASAAH